MMVLIDTPIWSLALRRSSRRLNRDEQRLVEAWKDLVRKGQAILVGPVRQEVLSGIRDWRTFDTLAEQLDAFSDLELEQEDFIRAAEFFNKCRARGVTGSAIDLLICAAAYRHGAQIFTVDKDFAMYARVLPLRLFKPDAPSEKAH